MSNYAFQIIFLDHNTHACIWINHPGMWLLRISHNMEFNFPLMAHLAWFEVGAILQEIVWFNAIVESPFWIQLL